MCASCVYAMTLMQFASEIVMHDIKPGFAEGKAIDMMQTAKQLKFDSKLSSVTNDYKSTEKSDVIVITSGILVARNVKGGHQYKREVVKDVVKTLSIHRCRLLLYYKPYGYYDLSHCQKPEDPKEQGCGNGWNARQQSLCLLPEQGAECACKRVGRSRYRRPW